MNLARPRTLSLVTTHQCTAACDHCCFACTPQVTKRIPPGRLAELIDEAADIPSIGLIAFTGGECFLLGRELDALIARAARHTFVTRCVTNGYWAVNRKAALSRITELKAAGLDELCFSTGTFHQKYVPLERVITGAALAAEQGLAVSIMVEMCDQSALEAEELRLHALLEPHVRSGAIRLNPGLWIPNGGGVGETALTYPAKHSVWREENKIGCSVVLDVLTVTPDLELVACCGMTFEYIDDLHLGSVATRSIREVLAGTPDDFLKIWIHVEGPERVIDFARKYIPDFEPPPSTHQCTTCLHLYRDQRVLEAVAAHYTEIEGPIVEKYMAKLRERTAKVRELLTNAAPMHSKTGQAERA